MELKKLEETLKLMKKYKVQEISYGEMTIKLSDDFESDLSPEARKALENIEKSSDTSDEDILYNPYAGLEVDGE